MEWAYLAEFRKLAVLIALLRMKNSKKNAALTVSQNFRRIDGWDHGIRSIKKTINCLICIYIAKPSSSDIGPLPEKWAGQV
jgi:hypothetical protein